MLTNQVFYETVEKGNALPDFNCDVTFPAILGSQTPQSEAFQQSRPEPSTTSSVKPAAPQPPRPKPSTTPSVKHAAPKPSRPKPSTVLPPSSKSKQFSSVQPPPGRWNMENIYIKSSLQHKFSNKFCSRKGCPTIKHVASTDYLGK